MKKRIGIFILSTVVMLAFITTSAAQSDIPDSMEFQGQGIEVTLEQAIEYMLKDNATIAKSHLDVEQAEMQYKKERNTLKELKSIPGANRTDTLAYRENRLFEMGMDFKKADAQRVHDATVEGLKADVEQAYFNLLQAQQLKEINGQNVAVAEDLQEKTKTKFELGLVSKQEVLRAELNYIKAQTEYKSAENMLKGAKMLFNIKIGYNVMDEVTLKDELKYKEFEMGSIAEAVEKALTNRREAQAVQFSYDLEKMSMELADKKYEDFMYAYREQKIKLGKALEDLETTRKSIEMEVRTNYLEVMQKQEEIKSGEKAVEVAQEALKLSQISYEAGMSILTDVQQAQLALLQAKLGLSQAILDYNLAILKFEDCIGIGRAQVSMGR